MLPRRSSKTYFTFKYRHVLIRAAFATPSANHYFACIVPVLFGGSNREGRSEKDGAKQGPSARSTVQDFKVPSSVLLEPQKRHDPKRKAEGG